MLTADRFLSGAVFLPRRSRRTPEVSILLPLGDRDSADGTATIAAILEQSHRDFELLIIDDAGDEMRARNLRAYRDADKRIALLALKQRTGLTALLLNAGITRAAGRYVGYQFPGARYTAEGLAELVKVARGGGDILVHGGTDHRHAPNVGLAHLEAGDVIAHPAMLHARDLFDRIGLFDPHLAMRNHFGWDFCQRAAAICDIRRVRTIVVEENDRNAGHDSYRAGLALSRMRSNRAETLAADRAATAPLADDRFLVSAADRAAFHSMYVLPWIAQCFAGKEARWLTASLIPPDPIALAVEGSVRSATIEMAFRNYADVFANEVRILDRAEDSESSVPLSADILVCLRSLDPLQNPSRARMRSQGKPIIYALDDDLLRLYGRQKQGDPKLEIVQQQLADADHVIAYSRSLTGGVAAFNPRVSILSMNTPARFVDRAPTAAAKHKLTRYVVIGRLIRGREFRWLADEMQAFFANHRGDAQLTIFADDRLEPEYRAILTGVDFDVVPLLKYRQFREFLQRSEFDFVINPLRDSPFNRGKSPVKYLEATMAGAVLITSAMSVYKPVRDDDTGIVVPWKKGAWHDALERAQSMPPARRAEIHSAAARHIAGRLSTEATYLKFRTTLEAARLHALLRSRLRPAGIPRVLVDDPDNTGLSAVLERLLTPYHFEIVSVSDFDPAIGVDAESRRATLRDSGIALVHATTPGSGWIDTAIASHVPAIAGRAQGEATRSIADQPDLILAATISAARAARESGFANVVRWTPPLSEPQPRTGKPLKRASDGIRIVVGGAMADAEGPRLLGASIAAIHQRNPELRIEVVATDDEFDAWREAAGTASKALHFVDGAPGTLRQRGVLVLAGSGRRTVGTAIEAFMRGVPVLAVAADILGEFGSCCREVEADAATIADAVDALFSMSPEDLATIRASAANRTAMLAGPEIAAANLTRFYRLAVDNAIARAGRDAVAPAAQ